MDGFVGLQAVQLLALGQVPKHGNAILHSTPRLNNSSLAETTDSLAANPQALLSEMRFWLTLPPEAQRDPSGDTVTVLM